MQHINMPTVVIPLSSSRVAAPSMSPLCMHAVSEPGRSRYLLRGIPGEARKAILDRIAPATAMRLQVEEHI